MNSAKKSSTRFPIFWLGLGSALLAVLLILLVSPQVFAQSNSSEEERRALQTFEQVFDFVRNNYVEEVDPDVLLEGALRGLFESLEDPHSAYLDSDDMRSLTDTTSGEFGGVGMYISKQERDEITGEVQERDFVEIVSPIEDTPAYRAGIQAGDLITSIEGESTVELSIDDVVNRLRGEPGTEVTIMVRRGENLEFPVTLVRDTIEVPTVKSDMIHGDIGFLRIIQFTAHTADRVKDAIDYFEDNNYSSMIIDLRSNPGGLLRSVVDVADLFFSNGLIVGTRGRVASENDRYIADRSREVSPDIPIVVLINPGSASASEILAGAMKDRDRALLLGETTYGKGSVQQIRVLGDSGFRLTMSRYYTPSGDYIDEVGVSPDIELSEPELSAEEEESYARIRNEGLIDDFLDDVSNPSERQIDQFVADLRDDGVVLNSRTIRRMVRQEVERRDNQSSVYDLDYDVILQEAVRLIEEGEVRP